MSSNNTFLNKGSKLKAVLTIAMIVSCAYATMVAPAAAFEGRDRGNSGYRHGGFGSRGGAYGFNRGNPYRHGGYGRGYNSGYRNGYGNNGYGYNSGGGGIIGGLLGGQ